MRLLSATGPRHHPPRYGTRHGTCYGTRHGIPTRHPSGTLHGELLLKAFGGAEEVTEGAG